jgi:uncharacterized repeat protein (TIGR03803 family)
MWAATARAQYNETVIYSPTSASDTGGLQAGVIRDSQGNLYGTDAFSGETGFGTIYELIPAGSTGCPAGSSSTANDWCAATLYTFCAAASGCTDGAYPYAGLTLDANGNLYGAAAYGGTASTCDFLGGSGCGTIFTLTPVSDGVCPAGSNPGQYWDPTLTPPQYVPSGWCETVLYNFTGAGADSAPSIPVVFDAQGNLYGAGFGPGGEIFELSPPSSGSGPWIENVIYQGTVGTISTLIFDSQGNLYATSPGAPGYEGGYVFELSPPSGGSGPWTQTVLYGFTFLSTAPFQPQGGVTFDANGNLYGTTESGGANGAGTVYELTPPSGGTGLWNVSVLYSFASAPLAVDGRYPLSGVTFDSNGNLYGTTVNSTAYGNDAASGVVYELSPPSGGSGSWTEVALLNFYNTTTASDGNGPYAGVILDPQGNVYGTTIGGGNSTCPGGSCGVVFELSPGTGVPTTTIATTSLSGGGEIVGQPLTFVAAVTAGPNLSGVGSDTKEDSSRNPTHAGSAEPPAGADSTRDGLASEITRAQATNRQMKPRIAKLFAAAPSGTMTFTANGNSFGCDTVAVSTGPGGGSAQCTTSTLAVGNYSIVATYSGDSSYNGSASQAFEQSVTQATSTTALAASPNPSLAGQTDTFTASVTGYSPVTGTVNFTSYATGTSIAGCSAVPLSSGVAQCSTSFAAGAYVIQAYYSGDTNNYSSSNGLTQEVNPGTTKTALGSSQNPSAIGQPVTFIATVTGDSPTGTVGFTSNGAAISGCSAVNLASGMASCATSFASAGTYAIVATYSGDSNNSGSSGMLSQMVGHATTTSLSSSANPAKLGASVTLTATVSGGSSPTGSVSFTSNGTAISGCSAVTLASSKAKCATTTLAGGTDAIVAAYSGDSNNNGSTSAPLSQVVITTTTVLNNSPASSIYGDPVALTATVTSSTGGTPAGNVTFYRGSSSLGTVALNGSGQATLNDSTLPVGTDSLSAKYAGNASYPASTSSTVSQVVSAATTTTSLLDSPENSTYDQTVTFTATVTASNGLTPTGTVRFFDGSTQIGSVALSSGVATLNYAKLPVGTLSITAEYLGNSDYSTSTSSAVSQTVSPAATSTSLTTSPDPSTSGQAVTLTATVTSSNGLTPTGTVQFYNNGTLIKAVSLKSGVATLSDSSLPVGMDSITAVYLASTDYATSTSSPVVQTVTAPGS